MSVKFRIGLTVDAQTLFGILAKFLPVEGLSVEEIVERPAPRLNGEPRIARLVKRAKTRDRTVNLNEGVNAILLGALANGETRRYSEFAPLLAAAGYSPTGVGSRLTRLHQHGIVERTPLGWRKKG